MPYLFVLTLFLSFSASATKQMSDAEIRQAIVKESIAAYKGICPCPYSTHPDGKQCGHRSAFSQKNTGSKGANDGPICYEINVTLKMVEEYRLKQALLSVDPNIQIAPSKPNTK